MSDQGVTELDLSDMSDDGATALGKAAARNLTTTTKSVPQMQNISSRWLLKVLPWVQVNGAHLPGQPPAHLFDRRWPSEFYQRR